MDVSYQPIGDRLNARQLMADEVYQPQDIWNDMNLATISPDNDTFDCLNQQMALTFGGECDDSSDEDDDVDFGASVLFNYKEKSFREDDIDMAGKIIVNVPDEMRERKCDACRQRFMLKDTFEQHLKECIELKLLKFITDGNQLLSMRKSRTLSSNEFVRRIIFSLKKTVKSLTLCYNEVADGTLPLAMVEDKVTKKFDLVDMEKLNIGPLKKSLNNGHTSSPSPVLTNHNDGAVHETSNNYLNLLEGRPNVSIQINRINDPNPATMKSIVYPSPIPHNYAFEQNHNNHSSAAGTTNALYDNQLTSSIESPIPTRSTISCTDLETKMFQRPPIASAPNNRRNETTLFPDTVIAQCNSPCGESFTSPQQFKEHVQQFHADADLRSNTSTPIQPPADDTLNTDERNKLLEMLASSSIRF